MAVTMPASADAPPYLAEFGLTEAPFQITPSERFAYLTSSTKEAIVHGRHVIEQRRGLGSVEGEIGTGKTTLAQKFAREQAEAGNDVAFLHRVPGGVRQTENKIFEAIAYDIDKGLVKRTGDRTLRELADRATKTRDAGRTLVVVVDDAHKSRQAALSAYLALLNLQAPGAQLVQLLLFGEYPEMASVLKSNRALHSRLSVHTRLNPLTLDDVAAMVDFRLATAGRQTAKPLFSRGAIESLHARSKGIPRIICTIANLACTFAWDDETATISAAQVERSADKLMHEGALEGDVS